MDAGRGLREMRRRGHFAELPEEAQATLLGGTLYAYGHTDHTAHVDESDGAERDAAPAALAMSTPPRLVGLTGGSRPSTLAAEAIVEAALQAEGEAELWEEELSESDGEGEGAVSIEGVDSSFSGGGSRRRSGPGAAYLDETGTVSGIGDTVGSSSTLTDHSQSVSPSARTVYGDYVDSGLASVLQRLTFENLSLDDSLARSVRRVLQLGTVLTGRRLSPEEIRALPTVRFEEGGQQNCAICLEAYQREELLTALHCKHFFHVDCLARWFHQSTQCPLCRSPCVD